MLMFLRFVKLAAGCSPPGGLDPTLRLQADSGPPVDLRKTPETVSIRGESDPSSAPVATATYLVESRDVYLVRVVLHHEGSRWQLQIANNDGSEREFTWVVADTDQDARQPWLNLPQSLEFQAAPGQTVNRTIEVANRGTGPLTLSQGGLRPGSAFQLIDVPRDIPPNACGSLVIQFTAPATVGTTEELYRAASNDPRATESSGHNDRIALRAVTSQPQGGSGREEDGFGECRRCTCPQFVSSTAGSRCERPSCGHDITVHRHPI